jgi:hypothetical protein
MRKTSDLYRQAVQKSIAMANNRVTFSSMAGAISSSITPDTQPEEKKIVEAPK